MSYVETQMVGRDVTRVQETGTGVLTQTGVSTNSTPTFSANEDAFYGSVQCWCVKSLSTADQAYDSAAAIVNLFGTTKVARNTKYRIIKVDTVIRQKRTGGTRASATKVQAGDGAASETFADLVVSVVDTANVANTPMSQILVNAETILLSGETLRIQHEVSGSTTGTEELDVYIYAVPVKA